MKHLVFIFSLGISGFVFGVSAPSSSPLAAPSPPASQEHTQEPEAFFLPAEPLADPAGTLPPGSSTNPSIAKVDSLLSYAKKLIGRAYVYGDTGKRGFDCSGFTSHVFSKFGINISRSSSTQVDDGRPISRDKARKGDLIVFTGTNPSIRKPGHVGIIISDPGEPISFVHSSSVGGVKISEVESTGYERRFLEVRRVL